MQFERKNLSDEALIHLYRSILLPRLIEEKMWSCCDRRISKWFSGPGRKLAVGETWSCSLTSGSCPCTVTWAYSLRGTYPFINYFINGREVAMDTVREEKEVFILDRRNRIYAE
jgi:hypothetical protein